MLVEDYPPLAVFRLPLQQSLQAASAPVKYFEQVIAERETPTIDIVRVHRVKQGSVKTYTMEELRVIARDWGLRFTTGAKKPQLVDLVREEYFRRYPQEK